MPTGPLIACAAAAVVACAAWHGLTFALAHRAQRRRATACAFRDEADDLPLAGWVTGWLFEVASTIVAAATLPTMLLRPRPAAADHAIVLVHGYASHRGALWLLRRRLRRDGYGAVVAVRYGPRGDLRGAAARLARALADVRRTTAARTIDVVAHGVGGLVARAHLCRAGADVPVRRLLTIGTPHQGTWAHRWARGGRFVRQLRPGSSALVDLEHPEIAGLDVVALYSADDPVVVPPAAGYCPGAFNIEVRGAGHLSLLVRRQVYQLLLENLAHPLRSPRARLAP